MSRIDNKGTVKVTVEVINANGWNSTVSVKDLIRWGADIPKTIDKIALEAATLAWDKKGNQVDRTQ